MSLRQKISLIIFVFFCSAVLFSCTSFKNNASQRKPAKQALLSPTQMIRAGAKANYFNGNYSRAFPQLKELAQEGDPISQYAAGYMYYYGLGVTQDTGLAQAWIDRAAKQRYPRAQMAMNILIG